MQEKRSTKQIIGLIIVITACISPLITSGISYYFQWRIKRDIVDWFVRAQVAANADDMSHYLELTMSGLEKHKLTTDYAKIIFKTPKYDMNLIYKALKEANERVILLAKLSKSGVVYQTGLDDLRGVIREIELFTWERWAIRTGWVYVVYFATLILWFPLGYPIGLTNLIPDLHIKLKKDKTEWITFITAIIIVYSSFLFIWAGNLLRYL